MGACHRQVSHVGHRGGECMIDGFPEDQNKVV